MRTKRVNRYYCDFCKKSGCSAPHMKRHEERCTMNPNRTCGVCAMMNEGRNDEEEYAAPLAELVAMWSPLGDLDVDVLLDNKRLNEACDAVLCKVREAAGNCPACILASIRQAGDAGMAFTFDFRAEMDAVWAGVNQSNAENMQHG